MELLFQMRRKMGCLGFYSIIRAVIEIFDKCVKPDDTQLPYLLTYKFSQDYLEFLFCCFKVCGEWCPNPTFTQFSSAYKRLLIHYEIAHGNGIVEMQDNTTSSKTQQIKQLDKNDPIYNKIANLRVCKKCQLYDKSCDQSFTNVISSDMLHLT